MSAVRGNLLLRDALGVMGNHQPPTVFFFENIGVKTHRTMTPGLTKFNSLNFLHFLIPTEGRDRRRS
jgi:hypothetical protein